MLIDREKLIDLLVERTGEDRAHMAQQLSELVAKIDAITKDGKKYTIQRFGTFYREEGELQFFPAQELATEINYKYVGMKPIELMEPYKERETSDMEGPSESIEEMRAPRRSEVEDIWEDEGGAWQERQRPPVSHEEPESRPEDDEEEQEQKEEESPFSDIPDLPYTKRTAGSRRIPQTPEEWQAELEARGEKPKQQDKPGVKSAEQKTEQKPDPKALNHPFFGIEDPDDSETTISESVESPAETSSEPGEEEESATEASSAPEPEKKERDDIEEQDDYREIFGFTASPGEAEGDEDMRETWWESETEEYEPAGEEDIEDEIDELEEIIESGTADEGHSDYESEEPREENEKTKTPDTSFNEGRDDREEEKSRKSVRSRRTNIRDRDRTSSFALWGIILAMLIIVFFAWLITEMDLLGGGQEQVVEQPQVEQPAEQPAEPAASETESEPPPVYGLNGTVNDQANDGYTIVIYSLTNGPNAKNVKRRLENQDYRVLLKKQFTSDGDAFWRISLGQFQTVSAARQAAQTLPSDLRQDFMIRRI